MEAPRIQFIPTIPSPNSERPTIRLRSVEWQFKEIFSGTLPNQNFKVPETVGLAQKIVFGTSFDETNIDPRFLFGSLDILNQDNKKLSISLTLFTEEEKGMDLSQVLTEERINVKDTNTQVDVPLYEPYDTTWRWTTPKEIDLSRYDEDLFHRLTDKSLSLFSKSLFSKGFVFGDVSIGPNTLLRNGIFVIHSN